MRKEVPNGTARGPEATATFPTGREGEEAPLPGREAGRTGRSRQRRPYRCAHSVQWQWGWRRQFLNLRDQCQWLLLLRSRRVGRVGAFHRAAQVSWTRPTSATVE